MHTIPEEMHAASRYHACAVVQTTRRTLRIAEAVYLTTTLHHHDGRHTVRFVRLLRHPREKVWSAILQHAESVERPFEIRGTRAQALMFDPPAVLECAEKDGLLRFELTPNESRTELVLTHTFADLPQAAAHASMWELWLSNLEDRLDDRPSAPLSEDRFDDLFTKYSWEFGPSASSKRPRSVAPAGALR